MKLNRHAVFWWIVLWAQLLALFLAYEAGFLDLIWTGDATMITSVIGFIHVLVTAKIGYDTLKASAKSIEHVWFATEAILTLGMIGTVLGFLIMMYGAFSGGLPTDPQGIQRVLTAMSIGMGSALWTTAIGLTSSLLLKLQTINLETLLGKR